MSKANVDRVSLRSAVRQALARHGAPTQADLCRAIEPAWGTHHTVAVVGLNRWLRHGRSIPLRAIEAALQHLDIEPEARAELARLRVEIERAEARIRELVG